MVGDEVAGVVISDLLVVVTVDVASLVFVLVVLSAVSSLVAEVVTGVVVVYVFFSFVLVVLSVVSSLVVEIVTSVVVVDVVFSFVFSVALELVLSLVLGVVIL